MCARALVRVRACVRTCVRVYLFMYIPAYSCLPLLLTHPQLTASLLRVCLLLRVAEESLLTLIDVGGVTLHVYNARFKDVTFRRAKPSRVISATTGAFEPRLSKLLPHFRGEGKERGGSGGGGVWDAVEAGGDGLLRDVFGGSLAIVSEPVRRVT